MDSIRHKKSNIETAILFLVIILIPFNDMPYVKNAFGELSAEGAFYPLFVLAIICFLRIISTGNIYLIKDKTYSILVIYLIWIIISGGFNYGSIISNFTKGRTGIEKYLLQVFVYIFGLISTNIVYFTIKNKNISLYDIRRYMLYSFLVVGTYSFFEILKLNNIAFANSIINKIDSVIRNKDITQLIYSYEYGRLRSVSGESSWFSMYATFIFPWLFSYIFEKKHKILTYIMIFYFFIMIYYTKSRTGYFIIAIEISLIFFFILSTKNKKIITKGLIFFLLLFISIGVLSQFNGISNQISTIFKSFSDSQNSYNYLSSNVARFASQEAAVKMGINEPIFGVGLGQYGFNMPKYIDNNALSLSWEVKDWASSSEDTPWAPVHALYPRIIGETGFIGILIWIYFCIYILLRLNNLLKKDRSSITLALMISFIGVLLAFFNIDSFRFFPFWIMVGIIMSQLNCIEIYSR